MAALTSLTSLQLGNTGVNEDDRYGFCKASTLLLKAVLCM